jgi:hypothetical protein
VEFIPGTRCATKGEDAHKTQARAEKGRLGGLRYASPPEPRASLICENEPMMALERTGDGGCDRVVQGR